MIVFLLYISPAKSLLDYMWVHKGRFVLLENKYFLIFNPENYPLSAGRIQAGRVLSEEIYPVNSSWSRRSLQQLQQLCLCPGYSPHVRIQKVLL